MKRSAMQSDIGENAREENRQQPASELPGVEEFLQHNPVKDCLRLYYYTVAIDVAVLVVGIIYLGWTSAETYMIPVYMIVRGALRLACLPFSVVMDSVPSMGWKNKTFIALEVVSNVIGQFNIIPITELTLFGWLIYGTVLVSKIWPGSDKDYCDKPCYLTAFSSIVIDWIWKLLITLAFFFPLCWYASEQWTTALFVLYISTMKSRKPPDNPSVQPV